MPIIDISKTDMFELLGMELSDSEIEQLLAKLKCEVETIENDIVYYEATHDRPDLFSVEGLVRALKGLMRLEVGLRKFEVYDSKIVLKNMGPKYRPVVLGATVEGLKLNEEAVRQIMQIQEKLHSTYCRNRRKVSIGVYDLSTITPPIRYIAADPRTVKFIPLDMDRLMTLDEILVEHPKGIEYGYIIKEYSRYPLLIDSEDRVLSMPPIINSDETKVTEDTEEVFIDVTAVDYRMAMDILRVLVTSIAERGEKIGIVRVIDKNNSIYSPDMSTRTMNLETELISDLVGINLSPERIVELLKIMRLDAYCENEDLLKCKIPVYRLDILHPVDLVEEVVMAYGYENLEPELLPPEHSGIEKGLERFTRILREIMIGFGMQEVANYMMTNRDLLYRKMNIEESPTIEVVNPKQEKYSCLRTWIVPQLIEVLSASKHAGYPQRIFEIGDVVHVDYTSENLTKQERHLAFVIADRAIGLTDALVLIRSLFNTLGLSYSLRETKHGSMIEGRCAEILVEEEPIGIVGEIHPLVLVNFELEVPVVACEINIEHCLRAVLSSSR
ncbi:MAG: phenylalanine--tRNA ligase subunit beta [Thermoprotei archaeon]|nr:MAG: phenylalanine--tRNA ligase subunit beta [Thermoprotei archaeon]